MAAMGYSQLVCNIFPKWEDVKDEILLPERKQGSGNGTIHVFLGAADAELQKEFSSYYNNIIVGKDPSDGAVEVKHYFSPNNIISMLGYVCQYSNANGQNISNAIIPILTALKDAEVENGLLFTRSLFKLSLGSNKLRPYFKQFDNNGIFNTIIRKLLLPNSAYKISLFKNSDGKYAAFWMIGCSNMSDFEANINSLFDHKDDIITSSTVEEDSNIARFMGKCLLRFLKYDNNLSKATLKKNTSTIGFINCVFGQKKDTFDNYSNRPNDCETNILWEVDGVNYYFFKEQTKDTLSIFADNFNEIYKGHFEIKIDNVHKLYQLIEYSESKVPVPNDPNLPLQQIYYGAPGTGKSHKINEITKSTNNFTRTTFHPDSDYSTFVGCYKPTMESTGTIVAGKEQTKISYSYVAQAFLQAYTAAWKNTSEPYYLIIEEINRGNCAQIFGDLFQLLDRDENGMSSYGITPDKDIANYLRKEFAKSEIENADIKNGNTMMLPSNLYILATMNTSDQSLFPIDSAFKRRWDWEYVPIEDAGMKHYIKIGNRKYDWWTFIDTINNSIDHITGSEDKKMGYWFVKPQNNDREITAKQFVGKVLFYLWNDVYKDYFDSSQSIFKIKKDDGTIEKKPFTYFFGSDADNRIIAFMDANGITGINLNNDEQVPEGLMQLDESSSSDSSELQEWRKQYWAEIKELMGIKGLDFRTTPTTRSYYQMSMGVTGISLINSINRNSGECWSGIYIEKQQADEYYPKFKSVKDELDRQIQNLEWIHEDDKYASIRISKSFANILNSEIREESKAWFAETSVQFNNVFKPIVEQIFK